MQPGEPFGDPRQPEDDPAELAIRGLLGLAELGLRVPWLRERWQQEPIAELALVLERIAERGQLADTRAREALLAVALGLVLERESSLLPRLREQARRGALLNLDRLVREGPDETPEFEGEARVPIYHKGRELTLGERRSLARRPTRLEVGKMLFDPDPLVLRQLLVCTQLTEDDVIRMAAQRPARVLALETLVSSFRWMARRRIRLTLILNPGCPHGIALPLISVCPRDDLELVVSSTTIKSHLRAVALEILERLPPLASPTGVALQ